MSGPDASDAFLVGYAAVRAMLDGENRKSVILKKERVRATTGLTDLANIAAREREVPLSMIDGLTGPTQEFVDEYLYLIGGAMAIPHYSSHLFDAVPIPEEVKQKPYLV